MGAFETKSMILAELLKQEKPFKASDIARKTGLTRTLIYNYLNKFIDLGAIEKNGLWYDVYDRDLLIDQVTSLSEDPRTRKAEPTRILDKPMGINLCAQIIVALRHKKHPVANSYKRGYLEEIDATIKELKNLRKYVNASTNKNLESLKDKEKAWVVLDHYVPGVIGQENFLKSFEVEDEE